MQLPCLPLVSTNKTPFPISSHECLKMPAFSSDSSDIYLRTAASGDPTPINASSLLHPKAISPSVCHHPSIPTISPRPRRHPPHTNLRSAVCAAPGSDRMDSSHSSHGAGRQEQQSIFQFHNGARRRWGVGGEGAGKTTNGMSADKMRRQEGRREKRKGGETEHFSSLKTLWSSEASANVQNNKGRHNRIRKRLNYGNTRRLPNRQTIGFDIECPHVIIFVNELKSRPISISEGSLSSRGRRPEDELQMLDFDKQDI